jgi:hypothetical protein
MVIMAERVLTLRELNRATLARQMLLEREKMSIPKAVERLVGLQAQQAIAPYIGLWTRLKDFKRDDLAKLIEDREIIKATLMRATLHLATAADYLWLRGTVQPALTQGFESIRKTRGAEIDFEKVITAAQKFLSEKPRSFAEISAMLTELDPEADVGAMRYGVRTHIPLIQVPVNKGWSYPGNPEFTLADSWLGKTIPDTEDFKLLVFRYLAAFGPASVTDIQTWSGLPKLKDALDKLKPELQVYRDEGKRELFDLPDVSLPDADTPAPERFLPEYDNLLLSHQKRTRVIADEYRKQVYLPGLRVASTILVDGFVRGAWKVEKTKGAATMTITPFAALTKQNRENLAAEGEKLVRFVEADAKSYEVRFAD